jgi:2-polyprenyl-6-methoxyphenol hydroxylase-like FAD-dependent oxidoreductase
MDDRALVIGAGIAGLATAIALQRAGRDVLVLERAPQLREVGAGISLWPNAVRALRRLGIGDAVEAAGAPAHDSALRSWRGAQLGPSITPRLEARFGAPLVLVHRARLQAVMRRSTRTSSGSAPSARASIRMGRRSRCVWSAAAWSAAPS